MVFYDAKMTGAPLAATAKFAFLSCLYTLLSAAVLALVCQKHPTSSLFTTSLKLQIIPSLGTLGPSRALSPKAPDLSSFFPFWVIIVLGIAEKSSASTLSRGSDRDPASPTPEKSY